MSESTYIVTGMTCGHCTESVTAEIATSISGVRKVEVDVEAGSALVGA